MKLKKRTKGIAVAIIKMTEELAWKNSTFGD